MSMEIILHSKGEKYSKFKESILKDETVNRASIVFKDAQQFGKEDGHVCIIRGDEERCNRALELAKTDGEKLAEEIKGKEKEVILKKIKEDEEKAIEGFGNILG